MPAETAHEIGIETLKIGLAAKFARDFAAERFASETFSELNRFGLTFKNPLGVAAGFDKNGVVVNQLAALGFGFVEVGTVTYHPQKGNEKPRLFRLRRDRALINRLGFNNEGTPRVIERLKNINPNCVLGVNIGKNKDVPNEKAIENYLQSFELAHQAADYIAVNVSSPNTPNLRELQKAEQLEQLLGELQKRNLELAAKPLLVKIAPDLTEAEVEAIIGVVQDLKLSGIIATNTSVGRDNLQTSSLKIARIGAGGLSGKPIERRSNEVIKQIYKYAEGKLPIVGVGGVFTAEDAFRKIACGASLVQAYTGFVYQGVTFAREINRGLKQILKERDFATLDEAIGSDNKF